jgi:hypothetical protein
MSRLRRLLQALNGEADVGVGHSLSVMPVLIELVNLALLIEPRYFAATAHEIPEPVTAPLRRQNMMRSVRPFVWLVPVLLIGVSTPSSAGEDVGPFVRTVWLV